LPPWSQEEIAARLGKAADAARNGRHELPKTVNRSGGAAKHSAGMQ